MDAVIVVLILGFLATNISLYDVYKALTRIANTLGQLEKLDQLKKLDELEKLDQLEKLDPLENLEKLDQLDNLDQLNVWSSSDLTPSRLPATS